MRIVRIEIEKYKSIKEWQKIEWGAPLLTFIGKNGSGKTNVLEALATVFEANSTFYYPDRHLPFNYKVIIELTKSELNVNSSTHFA